MVKITAEIYPDWNGSYALRLVAQPDYEMQYCVERTIQPEELLTRSIFDRVFESMKTLLVMEIEKQKKVLEIEKQKNLTEKK